jgi:hypothetical protein
MNVKIAETTQLTDKPSVTVTVVEYSSFLPKN